MKPERIFLVRHGQSHGNIDHRIYETTPDYKIELTLTGHLQSKKAGEYLRREIGDDKVAFYTSPFARTRQTLTAIKHNFADVQIERVREDPRIREQERGNLSVNGNRHATDKERSEFGTFYYRIPNGESGADIYDRCSGFLDTLYRDFDRNYFPPNAIIVTHGYTMRVLLMRWLHYTVEEFHQLKNPMNCGIFELRRDHSIEGRGRYQLVTDFPKRKPKQ